MRIHEKLRIEWTTFSINEILRVETETIIVSFLELQFTALTKRADPRTRSQWSTQASPCSHCSDWTDPNPKLHQPFTMNSVLTGRLRWMHIKRSIDEQINKQTSWVRFQCHVLRFEFRFDIRARDLILLRRSDWSQLDHVDHIGLRREPERFSLLNQVSQVK